jgi:hypothetical protein
LEPETPPQRVPEVAERDPTAGTRRYFAARWTLALFLVLWGAFYALNRAFPYMKNGSDIVMTAKVELERTGQIFPADTSVERVMIFGNSKVLAGFLPSYFDEMAAADKLKVSSFNSGFPGSNEFLSEFEALCARGQAPNVVLVTLPWRPDPPPHNLFHLVQDDHAVIEQFFPFRFWLRDFASFLISAREHGGVRNFYRESRSDAQLVVSDRGYYLITEQSRFRDGRIPDDFRLASDQPDVIAPRKAPPPGVETQQLNRLIEQHHIRCYYVPYYLRIGEAAPPPAHDRSFAQAVESATPCKLIGPDYFLYPNRLFSDQTHMNMAGAHEYTQALFQLVKDQLGQGSGHALQ